MLLGLTKIMDNPGACVPFETSLDLRTMRFGDQFPVQEPVLASGTVKNTAGVLVMSGEVSTVLHGVCDRCAQPFTRRIVFPIQAVLVTALENEDEADEWTFLLEGDQADLDEIVTAVFVLNMDSKLLCKEDCAGLCCRCGANLNEGQCNCKPEVDPRLAVLKQLLQDKK